MDIKQAILGYLGVLGVEEYQNKLSPQETQIGATNILGCLSAIEDRLTEKGDADSLSLLDIIRAREKVNGSVPEIGDPQLIGITTECARSVFNYYLSLQ